MHPRGNEKGHIEQFQARLTKWAPESLRRLILNSFGQDLPNGPQRVSEGSFLIVSGKAHQMGPRGPQKIHFEQFRARLNKGAPETSEDSF